MADDVLAVGQLLHYLRDVATQHGIAEAPVLVLSDFVVQDFGVALALLRHTQDHVQDVERVQNDLEVLISEELEKELHQLLRLKHDVLRVTFYAIMNVMQHFVDGLGPDSPVVLCVHYSLYLVCGDQFPCPC